MVPLCDHLFDNLSSANCGTNTQDESCADSTIALGRSRERTGPPPSSTRLLIHSSTMTFPLTRGPSPPRCFGQWCQWSDLHSYLPADHFIHMAPGCVASEGNSHACFPGLTVRMMQRKRSGQVRHPSMTRLTMRENETEDATDIASSRRHVISVVRV
ncbi:hypothetical protein N658DRAFT_351941 [Parathielavia hyrcaniae]|uniref:Uncharacterized protein n=1 Tax=Parathielavia hyrcaniae TaxID=113614 RepID=A0AAN6T2R2_9PEZI|nr:hypothetical protein N658DRAFT_351941 [Parathielavia hyrcaniae]